MAYSSITPLVGKTILAFALLDTHVALTSWNLNKILPFLAFKNPTLGWGLQKTSLWHNFLGTPWGKDSIYCQNVENVPSP